MRHIQGSSGSCGTPAVRTCIFLFLLGITAFLYWQFVQGVAASRHEKYCPPCICDCPSLLPQGSGNRSTDCTKSDPIMREEMDKNFVDLLTEELKLQEIVADDAQRKANFALHDAKKLSSQYQKEAEKCNLGMETCEEAREKAEEDLVAEKRISALWEQRAKTLGWKAEEITNRG